MVKHICPKCNRIFTNSSNYNKHINKKKSCVDNDLTKYKFSCDNCKKRFRTKKGLQYHSSKNICKNFDIPKKDEIKMDISNNVNESPKIYAKFICSDELLKILFANKDKIGFPIKLEFA